MRARSLVLFVSVLSLASCRDSIHPLEPPPRVGPSTSLQVELNPGSPIILTDNPDWQIQADVSGNTVVWADNRSGSWELWGCDVSSGLGNCSTNAVRLASDVNQFGTEEARPSLSGSVMVWRSAQSQILGCDLGGGSPGPDLDECETPSEIFSSPRLQTRPKVSGGWLVWRQQIQTGSALSHVYGCDISGGLGSCTTTVTQISPDAASISAPLAVGGSTVVWITESFDVAACDISAGLDACLADPAGNVAIIGNSTWPDGAGYFFPAISGDNVVFTRLGPDSDILGCSVGSSLANCNPANLTSSFGQAEGRSALDGGTLVWYASLFGPTLEPGIVACDISACESSAVQISTDPENPGTFPAVSGSIAVWQQGSGALQFDIMGVELGVVDDEPVDLQISAELLPAFNNGHLIEEDPADEALIPVRVSVTEDNQEVTGAEVSLDGTPLGSSPLVALIPLRYPDDWEPQPQVRDGTFSVEHGDQIAATVTRLFESKEYRELCVVYGPLGAKLVFFTPMQKFVLRSPNFLHLPRVFDYADGILKLFEFSAATQEGISAGDIFGYEINRYAVPGFPPLFGVLEAFIDVQGIETFQVLWTENSEHDAFDTECSQLRASLDGIGGIVSSPVNVTLLNPAGRIAGLDPETGIDRSEFPALLTTPTEHPFQFFIPSPQPGHYEVLLTGNGAGNVDLTLAVFDESGDQYDTRNFHFVTEVNAVTRVVVSVGADGLISNMALRVHIDVQPGNGGGAWSCTNTRGNIPVALLSTQTFDARDVDANTVRFGHTGEEATEVHRDIPGNAKRHVEDVNGDGRPDMIFHFPVEDTGICTADLGAHTELIVPVILTADTSEETRLWGESAIAVKRW